MSEEKLIGVTDLPIEYLEDDDLKVTTYITGLTRFIETCHTPMTIALQGDWGTGKTSFINLVNHQLKGNSKDQRKVETIVFNTWKYSQFNQEHNLSISFLSYIVSKIVGKSMVEILEETSKRVENEKELGAASKAFNILSRLAYSFTRDIAAQTVTHMTGMGSFQGPQLSQEFAVKENKQSEFERITYIDSAAAIEELKEAFEEAVAENLRQSGAERIVIFIDDLDRLDPVVAVELLEIIKLFLDVPNCVFVLAVDYGIVSKGVKLKHGDLQMDDEKANSFFDKMIQVPFRIPMEFYNFDDFLKNNLPNSLEVEELRNIIRYSVGNNPRSVKRLLNSYHLISNILFDRQGESEKVVHKKQYGLLMTVLAMQLAHEPLYDYFCSSSDTKALLQVTEESELEELLKEIDSYKKSKNSRKHFLFLMELKKYIFDGNLVDSNSEEAEENLAAFLTILSYSTITSEKTTMEEDDLEEIKLSEITQYSQDKYGVEKVLCDAIHFTKNSTVGRTFEIYGHVMAKNPNYASQLKDYRNLPEMKLAGIEPRLILPLLQELDEDPVAKAWIENNAATFIESKEKYVADLPKRKLPGTDVEIIINYSAVNTVQNLYYILSFLKDDILNHITVVLKKKSK